MCNSKNHPPGCTCGFGGDGHLGRRGSSSYSYIPSITQSSDAFLEQYPEFKKAHRVTACFVNPNARCPVCGESVYYYQNDHGSRVFFDELGPPWPKHPCTDIRTSPPSGTFTTRSDKAIDDISKWLGGRNHDLKAEFKKKNGYNPWPLATVEMRMRSGKTTFLVLTLQQKKGQTRKLYLTCTSLPKCCQTKFVVAVNRQKLSFFDTVKMVPVEVPIKRYRGPAAFLEAVIQSRDIDS